MDKNNLILDLSRLPAGLIAGAYKKFHAHPAPGIKKHEAVVWLSETLASGMISMDDVKTAPISTFDPAPTPIDPAEIAKIDAIRSTSNAAHDAALKATEWVVAARDEVASTKQTLAKVEESVSALTEKIGSLKIDESLVRDSVAQTIAKEFDAFKRAVVGFESVVADVTSVHITERKTFSDVFGVDLYDSLGRPLYVSIWNDPTAPAIDHDFVWTADILKHLALSDVTGEPIWFGGEKGTGKSETARQFCARTGRAFKRINFHKHTSAEEYLGATGLKDGETFFEPKDFLTGYTSPSTIILLDEITNADPGELAPLNGFLEPNACVSFGGKVWQKAPGVIIIGADNTFGSGDETGRHVGTRVQNSALVDRFARVVSFTFLPSEHEIKAVMNRTGCPEAVAKHVIEAITVCRQQVAIGNIVEAPSIRSAMSFIRSLDVLDAKTAWGTAIVNRQPSESHGTLWGIFETCINPNKLV
jgi:MoxR-like ATPase